MRRFLLTPVVLSFCVACGSDSAGPTPQVTFCIRGDIAVGGTVNGALAATDCDLADIAPGNGGYFESYRLSVAADTVVDVSLTSAEFDTFVALLRLVGTDSFVVVAADDDGGGGTNSRIGAVPLSAAEDYLVVANGYDYPDVGAYTLAVAGLTLADLLCIRGDITVGGTVNANLAATDCDRGDSYFETYRLDPVADATVNIAMSSAQFDTYLFLLRFVGTDSLALVASDDDGGGGTNSLISGALLSAATDYLVVANGFGYADVGDYALTVTAAAGAILGRAPSGAQPWRALVKAKPGPGGRGEGG